MNIYICLLLIINASLGFSGKPKQQGKPNIIFCLVDDLGWNDVSFHGSLQIPTPNIDTLAANGVVLNNYYTQPLCSPSRASLMTGIHPIRYGLQYNVLQSPTPSGLYLNFTLFPQHMKSLGYKTHAIGKWHLGFFHDRYTPFYRGFDSYLGYWTGKMDYYNHIDYETITNIGNAWGRVLRRNMNYADEYNGRYSTNLFTNEAVKIIHNHDPSKPLYMYLAYQAVHSANNYELYQAPAGIVNRFKYIKDPARRKFAATVAVLDDCIGTLFKTLSRKPGMLDNTILIISTDNGGESAGYRGGVGSNWPLRGNKGTTWEAGVRGTALIWSPLIKKSPRISTQFMSIMDWLPSIYYAAGGNDNGLGNIYGQNVWNALLNDTKSPREELLHNIDPVENVQTIRKGDFKLVIENYLNNMYNGWFGPSGRDNGISDKEYRKRLQNCEVRKVLRKRKTFTEVSPKWLSQLNISCSHPSAAQRCTSPQSPCLFNVTRDPCELTNIAGQYPEVVTELLALLQKYNATAVPLVNRTDDPRSDPSLYDYHWTTWADYYPAIREDFAQSYSEGRSDF